MSHARVIVLVLLLGACDRTPSSEPVLIVRSATILPLPPRPTEPPREIAAVAIHEPPVEAADDDADEDNDSGDDTIVVAATDNDRDGDHILDAVDRCPDQPEDFDGFQDSDGCPDTDVDVDAILDVEDKCPDSPSDNDFDDDDGCPEVL